jgi:hypothetical protein
MAVTDPKASGAIQCGVPIIVPRFCIVLYTWGWKGSGGVAILHCVVNLTGRMAADARAGRRRER